MTKGWSLNKIDPLLRLSLVGMDGIGALGYKPVFQEKDTEITFSDLEEIYRKSLDIYNDRSDDIEEIYRLGGSSGGARPKIWINYNESTDAFHYHPKHGYEPWIIKFPSSYDIKNIAKVEYVYFEMAKKSNIKMSKSKLFKTKSEMAFFGTKRFDIDHGRCLHMISVAGLLYDNYRTSSLDYGHIMNAAFSLTKIVTVYQEVLRLGIFNVLSDNKDDHSKNCSFLMDVNGDWSLSPAYDLSYANSSHGYQSTTVDGEGKNIKLKHFENLAKIFGVTNLKTIIEEVINGLNGFQELADNIKLPKNTLNIVHSDIQKKISNFLR